MLYIMRKILFTTRIARCAIQYGSYGFMTVSDCRKRLRVTPSYIPLKGYRP